MHRTYTFVPSTTLKCHWLLASRPNTANARFPADLPFFQVSFAHADKVAARRQLGLLTGAVWVAEDHGQGLTVNCRTERRGFTPFPPRNPASSFRTQALAAQKIEKGTELVESKPV